MDLLALIFGHWIYVPFSKIVSALLRLHGIKVGKQLYIMNVPRLKIRGRASNIRIGDNVQILGPIDIRNRENGRISIESGVKVDAYCRLVAARDAEFRIESGAEIGHFCTFNCGENISIGKFSLIGGYCLIQSSSHGIKRGIPVKEQEHRRSPISIGSDVWIGAHVILLPGVVVGDGAIISANSVVARNVGKNDIVAGVPARKVGERPE